MINFHSEHLMGLRTLKDEVPQTGPRTPDQVVRVAPAEKEEPCINPSLFQMFLIYLLRLKVVRLHPNYNPSTH